MKKFFGIFAILTLATRIGFAQPVTVDGVGVDRDSAIRDAKRNAVEMAIGTFISSNTLVNQAVLVLDEIYTKSQGFVRDVSILSESHSSDLYRVTARVDVDTNPDSALISELNMLIALNDPRIAVIVLQDKNGATANDEITETTLNDRLLQLGFSHVVDANLVAKLQNSSLLNSVYNGDRRLVSESGNRYAIDYLVLGKSSADVSNILLPQGDSYIKTQLKTGRANLNVKIIKFDTGDIAATFSVDGQGVSNAVPDARNKALQAAAEKAAENLEERFKKLSASPTSGLQVILATNDYSKVEAVADELRQLTGVQNVYIREHANGRAMLELDSYQKPHVLFRMLQEKSRFGLFLESISNNTMQIIVS